jgi:predicted HicB family RNase H-like nuclease
MKRLIDGVTYNTDTATLLAKSDYQGDWNNEPCPIEGILYQTRGGAFFIHEEVDVSGLEAFSNWDAGYTKTRFLKCSEEGARHWITTGEVEVFLNPFEEKAPEDETHGTVYVRMPASLKRQIEAAAESDGLSANSWAMRCFEKCLAGNVARTE